MAKWLKALIAYLLCVLLAVGSVTAGSILTAEKAEGAAPGVNEKLIAQLSDIYRQYDKNLAKADRSNPYAFKRLIVSGYSGNDYGAVKAVYDADNDFAVLQYDSEAAAKAAQQLLEAEGAVAEPDGICELDATGPGQMYPAGSEMLGTTSYINHIQMGSDDVLVAVIDSGVMYDHVRIADRFYNHGYDLSSDGMEDAYYDTTRATQGFAHATFVSGIIADNTPKNVQIVPFKVAPFGDDGAFTVSSVVNAINQAVAMGVKVINVSLHTTSGSYEFTRAINNAVKNGVCVCCCIGNKSKEVTNWYPACVSNAITVSAVNAEKEFTSFSNWSSYVDFTAPGKSVVSTYPGENGTSVLYSWSGTSFSAPYIAALCADIKSLDADMPFNDVYQTLCDFAEDLGDEGRDEYFGNGLPHIGDMVYTDGETYEYRIPQGTLQVNAADDYTEDTQPWKRFASKLISVNIDSAVQRVGDYMFCNMSRAAFSMPDTLNSVGDYAFYDCQQVREMTFDIDVKHIGYKAFGKIEDFAITGYRNTPAEEYALNERIAFHSLGCKHNYVFDSVEPTETEEGYSIYTCVVCGDQYTGPYLRPKEITSGVCGDTMRYRLYSNGMLLIYGSGKMYDYSDRTVPWSENAGDIRLLHIYSAVEEISPYAFQKCVNLTRITCHEENEYLKTDGQSLFSNDGSELLFTVARSDYTLPQEVTTLKAQALVAVPSISLRSNDHLTVENCLVYDKDGNILAALPSYDDSKLLIQDNIHIQENAFILTRCPTELEAQCDGLTIGEHGIGYFFNGTGFVKETLTIKALENTPAAAYAMDNGFRLKMDNVGLCGEKVIWSYDTGTKKLTLSGSGPMFEYESDDDLPWYDMIRQIREIEIGDAVTELSAYSFRLATGLKTLTLPVSLKAPENNTIWEGCTAIETLHITCGSGIADDYDLPTDNNKANYIYTPWFISQKTITDFSLDENVRYIGINMFRSCYAIKEVAFRQIEEIADRAFLACPYLKNVTVIPKETVFGEGALFAYPSGSQFGYYSNTKLYGYVHSSAQSYAEQAGAQFIPLDVLRGSVTAKDGKPFADLQIYLDETYIATTDANGAFVSDCQIENGSYTLTVRVHGAVIFSSPMSVYDEQVTASIKLRYADYVPDNIINAKDYAFALQLGFDEDDILNYGPVEDGENIVRFHKESL